MTYDNAEFWLKAGIIVWNIGLTAALWMRKPGLEAQESVKALRDDVHKMQADIRVMEETLDHMPKGVEVQQLSRDMATVKADNKAQNDALARVVSQLDRIESYLLHNR